MLSTNAERRALEELPADQDVREAYRADIRRRRRELRGRRPRWAGHSMRRGCVRHLQRRGTPRHIIEQQCRYRPGSRALARYLDPGVPWADNPTGRAGDPRPARADRGRHESTQRCGVAVAGGVSALRPGGDGGPARRAGRGCRPGPAPSSTAARPVGQGVRKRRRASSPGGARCPL
ncbi:hypothetical protein ACFT38_30950 [Streptomyces sp. NPDC056975]|uniref:hypothetical protein n=1 Tax=Streptomyces sp. NPDC056975 TaxID=3345985 RepID=UPI0036326FD8